MTAPLAEYSFRPSVLAPERHFRLFPDRLVVEEAGGQRREVPLSSVRDVHLKLHGTRQRSYYQCRIRADGGPPLFLQHLHFRGLADFEDRRHSYTPFVLALLRALDPHAAGVRIHSGSGLAFAGNLLAAAVIALLLVAALLTGLWLVSVLAALVLWRLLTLLGPSRPLRFAPGSEPLRLLPR